jgi:uncharacterized protein (DUF4415 family)
MNAMKTMGTTRPLSDSVISATPGFIIGLSWRTSLAARAMMSPTRWRLWNVWLLPRRLKYSSSRVSRSRRCPRVSMVKLVVRSRTPRTSTTARITRAIVSSRRTSGSGWSTTSNAIPVRRGTAENMMLTDADPRENSTTRYQYLARCDSTQRTGLRRSKLGAPSTLNSPLTSPRGTARTVTRLLLAQGAGRCSGERVLNHTNHPRGDDSIVGRSGDHRSDPRSFGQAQ